MDRTMNTTQNYMSLQKVQTIWNDFSFFSSLYAHLFNISCDCSFDWRHNFVAFLWSQFDSQWFYSDTLSRWYSLNYREFSINLSWALGTSEHVAFCDFSKSLLIILNFSLMRRMTTDCSIPHGQHPWWMIQSGNKSQENK